MYQYQRSKQIEFQQGMNKRRTETWCGRTPEEHAKRNKKSKKNVVFLRTFPESVLAYWTCTDEELSHYSTLQSVFLVRHRAEAPFEERLRKLVAAQKSCGSASLALDQCKTLVRIWKRWNIIRNCIFGTRSRYLKTLMCKKLKNVDCFGWIEDFPLSPYQKCRKTVSCLADKLWKWFRTQIFFESPAQLPFKPGLQPNEWLQLYLKLNNCDNEALTGESGTQIWRRNRPATNKTGHEY